MAMTTEAQRGMFGCTFKHSGAYRGARMKIASLERRA